MLVLFSEECFALNVSQENRAPDIDLIDNQCLSALSIQYLYFLIFVMGKISSW